VVHHHTNGAVAQVGPSTAATQTARDITR